MQQTTIETTIRNPVIFEAEPEEKVVGEPKSIHWTKDEYHYLAELGFFEGKRTEFLEGEIIEMPTMNTPQATGLTLTNEVLRKIFSTGFAIRNQMPLEFGSDFETVPDLVIVKGKVCDFLNAHPQTADLVVEVSDTTLRYNRTRKSSLYALNNLQDYWILNLKDKRLEICRRPIKDEAAYYGFSYAEINIFTEEDTVSPLTAPDAKIKVADLLP